jgi:hypothetical protein
VRGYCRRLHERQHRQDGSTISDKLHSRRLIHVTDQRMQDAADDAMSKEARNPQYIEMTNIGPNNQSNR